MKEIYGEQNEKHVILLFLSVTPVFTTQVKSARFQISHHITKDSGRFIFNSVFLCPRKFLNCNSVLVLFGILENVPGNEILFQIVVQLELLLRLEHVDVVQQTLYGVPVDERVDVHVHKRRHEELTVEPINETAMTRNNVAEIFYVERTLEAAREESAKRSDK